MAARIEIRDTVAGADPRGLVVCGPLTGGALAAGDRLALRAPNGVAAIVEIVDVDAAGSRPGEAAIVVVTEGDELLTAGAVLERLEDEPGIALDEGGMLPLGGLVARARRHPGTVATVRSARDDGEEASGSGPGYDSTK